MMGNIDLDITANITDNNLDGKVECIEINTNILPNRCYIQCVGSGMFLEDYEGSVVQKKLDIDNNAQRWVFYRKIYGDLFIKNFETGRVLSLESESCENGVRIVAEEYESLLMQQWKVVEFKIPYGKTYQVINSYSNKAIDNHTRSIHEFASMIQFDKELTENQLFRFLDM